MRKVELRMKEKMKYKVIKQLVDSNGNKQRAANKLSCTRRTINRLIIKYKKYGKSAFIHKNRFKKPGIAYSTNLKNKIINLYINNYLDANLSHFKEIVKEDLKINISEETIRLWLKEINILSPKAHRSSKKLLKLKLKQELINKTKNKDLNDIKLKLEEIDRKEAHPRRPRSKYMGEMIQMDASEYEWIKGVKWHLHLAIDDADGSVVGAYFDYEETLNGYYNVFSQILLNKGIPAMFYTDRRTVFEYKKKNHLLDDEDTFTQFSYSCKKLGVEIKTTSVPEAKGRIERLNETFQSRLPIELRRADVKNIEQANLFLNSYIKKYNERFALHLNITKSVYEKSPDLETINNTLSVISVRTIDHGNTIRYKNKYYVPTNKDGKPLLLNEGIQVLMVETFDKKLLINVYDTLYQAHILTKHEIKSKEFDGEVINNPIENTYEKPRKNPWLYNDFLGFLAKQKHRPEYKENIC